MNKTKIAALALLGVSAIWGSTFIIIKSALENTNPITLTTYRFTLAAFLILVYLLFKKQNLFKNLHGGVLTGIFLSMTFFPQAVGLQYTSATNSGFITGLFIVFVPILLALLFRKKFSLQNLITIILALTGLWFLTGGISQINFGDLITLITAFGIALHIIFSEKFLAKGTHPLVLTFQQLLTTAIVGLMLAIGASAPLVVNNIEAILSIVYLAVFASTLAYGVQLFAQKTLSSVTTGLIVGTEPIFAAFFSWAVGKEQMGVFTIIGGLLIFAAIVVSELKFRK